MRLCCKCALLNVDNLYIAGELLHLAKIIYLFHPLSSLPIGWWRYDGGRLNVVAL